MNTMTPAENTQALTSSAYAVAQTMPRSTLEHLFALPVERQAKILKAATLADNPKAYTIAAVFHAEIDIKRREASGKRQAKREAAYFKIQSARAEQELQDYLAAMEEFQKLQVIFHRTSPRKSARLRAWEAVVEMTLGQRICGDELLVALRAAGFNPASSNAAQQWLTRSRKVLKNAGASPNLLKQLRAVRGLDYKSEP